MTITILNLRADAEAEARRLTRARALAKPGDHDVAAWLDGGPAWMTTARRWRTRQALGCRTVVVWRVAFEDPSGAILESSLVAIALDLPTARRRRIGRQALSELVCRAESAIHGLIDRELARWRGEAECTARAFAAARTARRRAIAERASDAAAREFQPGLFDRRAERARSLLEREGAGVEAMAGELLTASLSFETMTLRAPQLLLVLTP